MKYLYRINTETEEIEKLQIIKIEKELVDKIYENTFLNQIFVNKKTMYTLKDENGKEFDVLLELGGEQATQGYRIFSSYKNALKELVYLVYGVVL